jgi:hypothetical protein
MFALNYNGLKKRETYDEVVDYLMNNREKIKYPNRLAKQIRNSPELSNLLDGDGVGALDIEQQQRRAALEVERQQVIREVANPATGGVTEQRAFQPPPPPPFNPPQTASSSSQTPPPPPPPPQSASSSSQTQFPRTTQETQVGSEVSSRATQAGTKGLNKETQARPTLRRQRQESTTYIPGDAFHSVTPEFAANLQGFVSDVENFVSAAAAREQQQNENIRRMVANHLQEETPKIPYLKNIGKETGRGRQRSRSPQLKPVQATMEIDDRPDDTMNPNPKAPPKKPSPLRQRTRSPKSKQKPRVDAPPRMIAPPRVIVPKASAAAKPPAKPTPPPPPPPKRSKSEALVKADAPPKRVKTDAPPKRSKSEDPASIQRRRSKLENLFAAKPSTAPTVEPPRPKPSTAPSRAKSETPAVIERRRSKLENLFAAKPSAAPAVEPPRPKPSAAPSRAKPAKTTKPQSRKLK